MSYTIILYYAAEMNPGTQRFTLSWVSHDNNGMPSSLVGLHHVHGYSCTSSCRGPKSKEAQARVR